MKSSAPGMVLPTLVGLMLGALVIVCAWIAVELAEHRPTSANEIAGTFGVGVVYVEDLECAGQPANGCFNPRTPDVIHLRPGLGDWERDVILHELAHVIQHRAGMPGDECAADRLAVEMGALYLWYAC